MTLHEHAVNHGSDKGKAHRYCNFYESRIGTPKSILEFGILNGASLKMWRDAYPGAEVVGMDIEAKPAINNCFVLQGDCTQASKVFGNWDLILDDAGHFTADQIKTFELWWPTVNKGGCFIIEDCHTMHYEHYNPNNIDFKAWVKGLGLRHEYYNRVPGNESDSMTVIFYK